MVEMPTQVGNGTVDLWSTQGIGAIVGEEVAQQTVFQLIIPASETQHIDTNTYLGRLKRFEIPASDN